MTTFHLMAIGAGLGGFFTLTAVLGQLKYISKLLLTPFIATHGFKDNALVAVITGYMLAASKKKKISLGERYVSSSSTYIRPLGVWGRVFIYLPYREKTLFWINGRPMLLINPDTDEDEVSISYIRGTVDWKGFLKDALEWEQGDKNEAPPYAQKRFAVYKVMGTRGDSSKEVTKEEVSGKAMLSTVVKPRSGWELIHWEWDDLGIESSPRAMTKLALSPELEEVVEEVRFWKDSEEWCEERDIPWKLGCLGYGPPGTGKTSFVRALAEELDFPVYSIDLSSMTNKDLVSTWETMRKQTPCIALLEDIDAVFVGRKNMTEDPKALTFDCLLNTIDGVERVNGMLLFITTNNPHLIDPAIGGFVDNGKDQEGPPVRPGRIDRVVRFTTIDENGRKKLALRIMKGLPDIDIAQAIIDGANDSAAQFQNRCHRIARLALFSGSIKIKPKEKELRVETAPIN